MSPDKEKGRRFVRSHSPVYFFLCFLIYRVGGNSIAKKKGDDLFDLVDAVAKLPTPANTVVKKDKVQNGEKKKRKTNK